MHSIRATGADRGPSPTDLGAAVLALCVALCPAIGCKAAERGPTVAAHGNGAPQSGGELRFSVPTTADTLDPAVAYDEISFYAINHIYDTLLDYGSALGDTPGALVPRLAESWEVSPDGTVYSFELRAGLRYSDGRPCVAGDFKYALERVLTTPASPFGQHLDNVVGAKELAAGDADALAGVRVIGDRKLEITLREPDASFPYVMAMAFTTPLSAEHVAAVGDQLRRRPLGTGPFSLVSWDEGRKLVLARNPHYWDQPLPHLDRLVMHTGVPPDTAFLKFEAGELDTVANLSAADYLWLRSQPAWQPHLHRIAQTTTVGARMNCSQPPFDDVRVRQAMNYAVDKHNIAKIMTGVAEVAHGMLPPAISGHDDSLPPYPHDPGRARALLAAAGYPDGFTVEYATFKEAFTERMAQSMQADLKKVGIDMKIVILAAPVLFSAMGRPDGSPFSYMGWQADYPDPSNMLDVNFHSRHISAENSSNNAFYRNPGVDRLLDAARRETDPDSRREMYEELDRLLHDEAPWLWLYHFVYQEVVQPYVAGYAPHPIRARDFRTAWLDLPPNHPRLGTGARKQVGSPDAPASRLPAPSSRSSWRGPR